MQRIICFLIVFIFLQSVQTINAQTGKEPIKVTDMLKIKSIGGVSLSKDGSKAVFTVTTIETDGESKWEYKYVTQIWIANTDGDTSPRQLTTKESSSQPSFSPDGKKIVGHTGTQGGFLCNYMSIPEEKFLFVMLCNAPCDIFAYSDRVMEVVNRHH